MRAVALIENVVLCRTFETACASRACSAAAIAFVWDLRPIGRTGTAQSSSDDTNKEGRIITRYATI